MAENGSSSNHPMPILQPKGDYADRPAIPLRAPITIIGAREHSHVRLKSRSVSRVHALVLISDERIHIRDIASRTGTFVNNAQVPETDLLNGDHLRIGRFVFQFHEGAPRRSSRRTAPLAHFQFDGRAISIDQPMIVIGRREGSDILLADEQQASSTHAVIYELAGRHHVRDLHSRNGTIVNTQKVKSAELRSGDIIRIGRTALRYVLGPPIAQAPQPAALPKRDSRPVLPAAGVAAAAVPALAGAPDDIDIDALFADESQPALGPMPPAEEIPDLLEPEPAAAAPEPARASSRFARLDLAGEPAEAEVQDVDEPLQLGATTDEAVVAPAEPEIDITAPATPGEAPLDIDEILALDNEPAMDAPIAATADEPIPLESEPEPEAPVEAPAPAEPEVDVTAQATPALEAPLDIDEVLALDAEPAVATPAEEASASAADEPISLEPEPQPEPEAAVEAPAPAEPVASQPEAAEPSPAPAAAVENAADEEPVDLDDLLLADEPRTTQAEARAASEPEYEDTLELEDEALAIPDAEVIEEEPKPAVLAPPVEEPPPLEEAPAPVAEMPVATEEPSVPAAVEETHVEETPEEVREATVAVFAPEPEEEPAPVAQEPAIAEEPLPLAAPPEVREELPFPVAPVAETPAEPEALPVIDEPAATVAEPLLVEELSATSAPAPEPEALPVIDTPTATVAEPLLVEESSITSTSPAEPAMPILPDVEESPPQPAAETPAPEPEPIAEVISTEPSPEPVVEAPMPALDLAPEPVADVLQEPVDIADEPAPIVEPEPVAQEGEYAAPIEPESPPEPEPVAVPEPDLETELARVELPQPEAEPAIALIDEPRHEALIIPPAAEFEVESIIEPEPAPVATVEPEPIARQAEPVAPIELEAEPEPVAVPEPDLAPLAIAEPEPEPVLEPELARVELPPPEAEPAPIELETEPAPIAAVEPEPEVVPPAPIEPESLVDLESHPLAIDVVAHEATSMTDAPPPSAPAVAESTMELSHADADVFTAQAAEPSVMADSNVDLAHDRDNALLAPDGPAAPVLETPQIDLTAAAEDVLETVEPHMAHSTVELDPLHELTSTTPPAAPLVLSDADIDALLADEPVEPAAEPLAAQTEPPHEAPAAAEELEALEEIEDLEPVAPPLAAEPEPVAVAPPPEPTPAPPPAKPAPQPRWSKEFLLGDDPPPLPPGAKPVWQTNAAFSIPSIQSPALPAAAAAADASIPIAVPTPPAAIDRSRVQEPSAGIAPPSTDAGVFQVPDAAPDDEPLDLAAAEPDNAEPAKTLVDGNDFVAANQPGQAHALSDVPLPEEEQPLDLDDDFPPPDMDDDEIVEAAPAESTEEAELDLDSLLDESETTTTTSPASANSHQRVSGVATGTFLDEPGEVSSTLDAPEQPGLPAEPTAAPAAFDEFPADAVSVNPEAHHIYRPGPPVANSPVSPSTGRYPAQLVPADVHLGIPEAAAVDEVRQPQPSAEEDSFNLTRFVAATLSRKLGEDEPPPLIEEPPEPAARPKPVKAPLPDLDDILAEDAGGRPTPPVAAKPNDFDEIRIDDDDHDLYAPAMDKPMHESIVGIPVIGDDLADPFSLGEVYRPTGACLAGFVMSPSNLPPPRAPRPVKAAHRGGLPPSAEELRAAAAVPPPPPTRTNRKRLSFMLALMAGGMAATYYATTNFVRPEVHVEGSLGFSGLSKLDEAKRKEFHQKQARLVSNPAVLKAAVNHLAISAPGAPAGFLAAPNPAALRTEWLLASSTDAKDTLHVIFDGHDARHDSRRLSALLRAMHESDAIKKIASDASDIQDALNTKRDVSHQADSLLKAMRDRTRQLAEAAKDRPGAARLDAVRTELESLDTAWKKATNERHAIASGVERLQQAAPPSPSDGQAVAPPDAGLAELAQQLADAKKHVEDAKTKSATAASTAHKSLDTSIEQFDASLKLAKGVMADNPALAAYVESASKLHQAAWKLQGELIASQQEAQRRLVEFERRLADQAQQKTLQTIANDPDLKELNATLDSKRKDLRMAEAGGLFRELRQLQEDIKYLAERIAARKLALGEDPFFADVLKGLQGIIDTGTQQLAKSRKDSEAMMNDVEAAFKAAAPQVENLTPALRELAQKLTQQAADMQGARREYMKVAAAQDPGANEAVKALEAKALELAAALDLRRRQAAAEQHKRLTDQQAAEVRRQQELLAAAEKAERDAAQAHLAKSRELTDLAQREAAARELDRLAPEERQLDEQAKAAAVAFKSAQDAAASVIVPAEPVLTAFDRNTDRQRLYTSGGMLAWAALFGLVMLTSSVRALPPQPAPAPRKDDVDDDNAEPAPEEGVLAA